MHISIVLEHAPDDGYSRLTTVSIWFIPYSVLKRFLTALFQHCVGADTILAL